MNVIFESGTIRLLALVLGAGLCLSFAQVSNAGDAAQACRTMMEKLSVSAEMSNWDSIGKKWTFRKDLLRSAELVVMGAYSANRQTLEEDSPGLFDWSVAAVLSAWRSNLTPEEFASSAYVDCVAKYSK